MYKGIVFILNLFLLLVFCPPPVNASEEFNYSYQARYDFHEDGTADVNLKLTVENRYPTIKPKSINLFFNDSDLQESIKVFFNSQEKKNYQYDSGKLTYHLSDGEGYSSVNNLMVSFKTQNYSQIDNDTWEVTIPKINDFQKYTDIDIRVNFPGHIKKTISSYPNPINVEETQKYRSLFFDKTLGDNNIQITIGDFLFYKINLEYYLKNDTNRGVLMPIILPPDTSNQRVTIDNLSITPKDIYEDIDGNWIAQYFVKANQEKNIKASFYIQVFSKNWRIKEYSSDYLTKLTKEDLNWPVNNISKYFAQISKDPQTIIQKVTEILNYSENPLTADYQRKGIDTILKYPERSICLDYSDLAVTILRSKNIPSRMIVGYLDENNIKPSEEFGTDILHSWVEYWEPTKKTFVQTDPTAYDMGIHKSPLTYDLKHLTFVIWGTSSSQPLPPGAFKENSGKKIIVQKQNMKNLPEKKPEVNFDQFNILNPFRNNLRITIKNSLHQSINDETINLYQNETLIFSKSINHLMPMEQTSFSVDLSQVNFLDFSLHKLTLKAFNNEYVINDIRIYILLKYLIYVTLLLTIYWIIKTITRHD